LQSKKIIAIGASTGGVAALEELFAGFAPNIPPTVLVIHMPVGFTKLFALRLNEEFPFTIKEAQNRDVLQPGQLLVAPAGRHMKIVSRGGIRAVECFSGPKVQYVIPAADVLFESVARVCGADAVGVILTGMGADGADGLLKMRQKGAVTIGQNKETCAIYGMSKVAKEIGAVQHELPLGQIAQKIMMSL